MPYFWIPEFLQPRDLACGRNSLPDQLRNPDITYGLFRRQLKGRLFREARTRRSVTSDMRRNRKTLTYFLDHWFSQLTDSILKLFNTSDMQTVTNVNRYSISECDNSRLRHFAYSTSLVIICYTSLLVPALRFTAFVMLMHYRLFTVYFVSYTYMSDCLLI